TGLGPGRRILRPSASSHSCAVFGGGLGGPEDEPDERPRPAWIRTEREVVAQREAHLVLSPPPPYGHPECQPAGPCFRRAASARSPPRCASPGLLLESAFVPLVNSSPNGETK